MFLVDNQRSIVSIHKTSHRSNRILIILFSLATIATNGILWTQLPYCQPTAAAGPNDGPSEIPDHTRWVDRIHSSPMCVHIKNERYVVRNNSEYISQLDHSTYRPPVTNPDSQTSL
jgi:hypothetical protein